LRQHALTKEALALDGKSLRGRRTTDQTAEHLVAAYNVESGAVEAQTAVADKTNEIPTARLTLQAVPLAGRVVTGDALLAQRELSKQIVNAKGAYVWVVKANQPELRAEIERLFAPERCLPGHSPPGPTLSGLRRAIRGMGGWRSGS
jgi:hypothetical protein